MKKSTRFIPLLFVVAIISAFTIAKRTPDGTWNYELKGVPEEYRLGKLAFEQKDDKLQVMVNDKEAENVKAVNDSMYFSIEVSGTDAFFNLEFKDTTVTGVVKYNADTYPLSGSKAVPVSN